MRHKYESTTDLDFSWDISPYQKWGLNELIILYPSLKDGRS
jgi:hypothetical protein